jgi:hypothetical protein
MAAVCGMPGQLSAPSTSVQPWKTAELKVCARPLAWGGACRCMRNGVPCQPACPGLALPHAVT